MLLGQFWQHRNHIDSYGRNRIFTETCKMTFGRNRNHAETVFYPSFGDLTVTETEISLPSSLNDVVLVT